MKSRLIARRGTSGNKGFNLTGWDFFLMGAISKLIATSLTYPYMYVFTTLFLFFVSFFLLPSAGDTYDYKYFPTKIN